MAKVDDRVMKMVAEELSKSPKASSSDLFQKVKSVIPTIEELTLRQFHARYPLQVKRRAKQEKAAASKARKPTTARVKKVAAPRTRRAAAPKTAPAPKAPRPRRVAARRAGAPVAGVDRDAIRQAFIRFGSEVAAAKEPQDVFKLMTQVDRYVDQVIKAASS